MVDGKSHDCNTAVYCSTPRSGTSEQFRHKLNSYFNKNRSAWRHSGAFLCHKHNPELYIHYIHCGVCIGYDLLSDGRRHVAFLYVAGDLVNSETLFSRRNGRDVVVMGETRVGSVPLAEIEEAVERDPMLREAIIYDIARRHSILEAWVCTLGRKSALERMAFLFCELASRLNPGQGANRSCIVPFSQPDLADILGISPVHTNRLLRTLREMRLATYDSGHIEIHDFDALADIAQFDPTYLI